MIKIIKCSVGPKSLEALALVIAQCKDDDPFRPVFVVAPSREAEISIRRALAIGARRGFVNVMFGTSLRLASHLAGMAGLTGSRRTLDTSTSRWFARKAVDEVSRARPSKLSGFLGVDQTEMLRSPRSIDALVESFRRLDEYADREELTNLVSAAAIHGIPYDTVMVIEAFLEYKRALAAEYLSPADLFVSAQKALEDKAVTDIPVPIWYLPMGLSYREERLIASLSRVSPQYVIAGTTGDPDADSYLETVLDRIAGLEAISCVEKYDFSTSPPSAPLVEICTSFDAEEEIRSSIRIAQGWVRKGVDPSKIAIAYASISPYEQMLFDYLKEAEVEFWASERTKLSETVAGAVLERLLLVLESGFRRDAVISLAAAVPPSARRFEFNGQSFAITPEYWDALSREKGIVAGPGVWMERLEKDRDSSASRAKSINSGSRRETAIEAAHAFVEMLCSSVPAAFLETKSFSPPQEPNDPSLPSWSEAVDAIAHLVTKLLAPAAGTREGAALVLGRDVDGLTPVVSALTSLSRLDAVGGQVTLDDFVSEVKEVLEEPWDRGEKPRGLGVGPLHNLAGTAMSHVVVVGAQEGALPVPESEDSLLRPAAAVLGRPEVYRRGPSPQEQRLRLYTLLASARRRVLCYPIVDLRQSRFAHASWWVLDMANARAKVSEEGESVTENKREPRLLRNEDLNSGKCGDWHLYVPSLEAGIKQLGAAEAQEANLLEILEELEDGVPIARCSLFSSEPSLARRALRHEALESRDVNEWWGIVAVNGGVPNTDVVRPTSLEHWAVCPYRFFLGQVLSVSSLDRPEDISEVQGKDLGSAIHEVLHRLFASDEKSPQGLDERLTSLGEIIDEVFEEYFSDAAPGGGFFSLERIKPQLLRALENAVAVQECLEMNFGQRPWKFEYAFDEKIVVGRDGHEVHVRGRADRIDRVGHGEELVVVDFKSTRSASNKHNLYGKVLHKVTEASDALEPEEVEDVEGVKINDLLAGGKFLQIPLYMLCSARLEDCQPKRMRGMIWQIDLSSAANTVYAGSVDVSDLEAVKYFLAEMVDCIRFGLFVPNPGPESYRSPGENCDSCDFNRVCTQDRARIAKRKENDPVFVRYTQLTTVPEQDK